MQSLPYVCLIFCPTRPSVHQIQFIVRGHTKQCHFWSLDSHIILLSIFSIISNTAFVFLHISFIISNISFMLEVWSPQADGCCEVSDICLRKKKKKEFL